MRKGVIHGTKFLPDTHVVFITMAVDRSGKTEGYWLLNGQRVALAADAKASGLPLTESGYMLKELFIIRGAKVAE